MRTFEFQFEELPLLVVDNIESGLINGTASISYNRDGAWTIEGLCLEGFRAATEAERAAHFEKHGYRRMLVNVAVPLPAEHPAHSVIVAQLEGIWRSRVQDEVIEQIALDREAAADAAADHRRDERMVSA